MTEALYPEEYEKTVTLSDGTTLFLRPELATDTEMLWTMFSTLSQESLRFLVRPFPRERIENWTSNINYEKVLPIVAVVQQAGKTLIVASASLVFHEAAAEKHKAEFGITVHDSFQNRGLGTALTKHLISIARQKGITKITLTTLAPNKRAIHVYEKCGFIIEAKLQKENFFSGEYFDDYIMSLFL